MTETAEQDPIGRVIALAERQLDMDRQELSGPSITLGMLEEFNADTAALASVRTEMNWLRSELGTHILHKSDASKAVREALSLCQHTPQEWIALKANNPDLMNFKLKIFGTLEMPCLNLGYGIRKATGHEVEA